MKFFPDFLVPDPDRKINKMDQLLIDKIIEKLVVDDRDLRLFKQSKHAIRGNEHEEIVLSFIKNKDEKIYISFTKVSIYDKNNFDSNVSLIASFYECMNDIKLQPHVNEQISGWYLPGSTIDTEKLCGIKITLQDARTTSFAVASVDVIYSDPGKEQKISRCADNNLNLYIDWIRKGINEL